MTDRIINLTRGIPPAQAFPKEDLIQCAEGALRQDADTLLQYGVSPGYAPLRQWLGERHGVGPEQVLLGNSSLELLSFIIQCCVQPGTRVFVESPTYDRTITQLQRTGAQVVGIRLEQDGLDLAALERALEQGPPSLMYVITDFQNPSGSTCSLDKRRRLAELARAAGFMIVEDAPYRPLRYAGRDIPSLWSLAPEQVLHMSSFSKTLAPGLRLGYVVGPAETLAKVTRWAVDTYIGPVFPTQGIVHEYCRRGLLDQNIERLRDLYRPRLEATLSALEEHLPQATWTQPEGGFFVGVTLPEGSDIVDLQKRAAASGLKITDGRGFFPEREHGQRFLRIPFCSVSPQEMQEAIRLVATLV